MAKPSRHNPTLADLLSLVPSDTVDIPTAPDVSSMAPLAAAKAMAEYHRTIAGLYRTDDTIRRARTRAMIIVGAIVAEHAPPDMQDALRQLITTHASPRDLAASSEVVAWLANNAIERPTA